MPILISWLAFCYKYLKKCSYDNQQEDIYNKPPSIEFLVWKGLLATLRPKCGRKEGTLGSLDF